MVDVAVAVNLFDAHLHLQDARLDGYRADVLAAAVAAGVTGGCCCGSAPDDWEAVLNLAAQHGPASDWHLLPALGVHPWYVGRLPETWLADLEESLAAHPDAPVGEVGLDGLRRDVPRDLQGRVLAVQLELAVRFSRPVVLHGARIWGDLAAALRPYAAKVPGFVAHGFGGSLDVLRDLLAMGGYISFAGSVCNPSAVHVRAAAAQVPADRLLIETDAPDIFPPGGVSASPTDSRLNQPANLRLVLAAVAEIRQQSPDDVAAATSANARRVYGLAAR